MNKQFKLSLLAASLVTAFAANVAYAGNVASSNPQIAREVITADAQAVKAPEASYAFQGDLNLQSQDQTMQVQITLTGGGTWTLAAADSIELYQADGTTKIPHVGVVTPTIGNNGKTLFATLTFAQAAATLHKNPVVRFNKAASAQSSVKDLFSVVGKVASCDKSATQLPFTVKHFTGVAPGSTVMAVHGVNGAFEDESKRAGANNDNVLMSFPTNLGVVVDKTVGPGKVDVTTSSTKFTTGDVALPTNATIISPILANLGSVRLTQQADGYDSGLVAKYRLDNAVAPAGVNGVAAATRFDGAVEAKSLKVQVTASTGFAGLSSIFLSTTANCAAALNSAPAVSSGNGKIQTVSLTPAEVATAFGSVALAVAPVHVCYGVPGTTVIPNATFDAVATLVKADGNTTTFPQEQDNACEGPLYPLGGAVKIDVRNYSTKATNGWDSVIRLINPSESNTAIIYGQLIHANGQYGAWGKLMDLAPRATSNLFATELNKLLVNKPVSGAAGDIGANQPVVNGPANAGGDRLRISAEGVGSLRVQNYVFNEASGQFFEASAAQGVDYDGSGVDDRAAGDAQRNNQDAQAGLRK